MKDEDLPYSAAGTYNPWLIAVIVSIATFMEVLDSTIANVSLRHIAGSLAASQDQSTYILTSYLVSNGIVVPISGWLANVIGRKRFYMLCVCVFTVSSVLCATATSLPEMLLWRVVQGLGGGGLAPVEQSIFTDTFPVRQRSMAYALYGFTVVLAPAIGPVLGGWLTDSFSWRWVFLINLPIGLLSLVLVGIFVVDSPALKDKRRKLLAEGLRVDYIGFALVALLAVLSGFTIPPQNDEGSAAHIFQLSIVLVVPAILVFVATADWKTPWRSGGGWRNAGRGALRPISMSGRRCWSRGSWPRPWPPRLPDRSRRCYRWRIASPVRRHA